MRIVSAFIRHELAMFILLLFLALLCVVLFSCFFYGFVYLGTGLWDNMGILAVAFINLGVFVFCFDFAHEYYKKIIFVSKELKTDIESIAILSSDTLQGLYDECVERKIKSLSQEKENELWTYKK